MRIFLACSVLLLGVVACVGDPEPDPVQDSTRASSEAKMVSAVNAANPDTEPQTADGSTPAAIPEDLQLITPRIACNKPHEGCLVPNACRAVGHPVAGSCPAGKQCCEQNVSR
jgi:hypothetical protein